MIFRASALPMADRMMHASRIFHPARSYSVCQVLGGLLASLAIILPRWRSHVHVLWLGRCPRRRPSDAADRATRDNTDRASNQPDRRTCRGPRGGTALGALRFPRATGSKQTYRYDSGYGYRSLHRSALSIGSESMHNAVALVRCQNRLCSSTEPTSS
jgi:hypothetical protein